MSLRNALKRAAGLLVEFPETDTTSAPQPARVPPRTVEQIVRESPGPNLDEIRVEPKDVQSVPAPSGQPNFAEVYRKASLPQAQFSAEQALEVMHSLPADLPLEVRRKTVAVTLAAMGKAMGVTIDSVVADASRKLAALTAYSEALTTRTADYVTATEKQITDLESKISDLKKEIEETKGMLANAVEACRKESEHLDDVLEFFSKDVPPSKLAPGAGEG